MKILLLSALVLFLGCTSKIENNNALMNKALSSAYLVGCFKGVLKVGDVHPKITIHNEINYCREQAYNFRKMLEAGK